MAPIEFVQARDIPLSSGWKTILTAPFVSTKKDQAVKLDVFLLTHWDANVQMEAGLGLQFRLLRDGDPVYTGEPVIFNYLNPVPSENQRLFNFFYVDRPTGGAYTYQLQAQVTLQSYIKYDVTVVESAMAVQVVDHISSTDAMPVYVSYEDQNGNGFVAAIDAAEDTITATIPVGRNPGSICISPDGSIVYVVNQGDNTISLIDTQSNSVTSTLTVGLNPKAVMVTPDNRKTYVANYDDQSITIINNATQTVNTVSTGGGSPFALVACPNSWFMYAACKVGGTNDYIVAIDVNTDNVNQFAQGGWELSFDTDYNPLVVKPDGHMVAALGPHNHLRRVNGPDNIGPGNSVDWLDQTVSGVYLGNGYFFATRDFDEATIKTAFELAINADGSLSGNQVPDTASHTGQNKIQAAPDHNRVCVSITANGNQYSGLQIIDFINQQGELLVQTHFVQIDSQFIEFPVANNIAITADSAKAYVTQNEYVHPVDIINFRALTAVHMGNYTHVRDVVGAYRSRS